MILKGLLQKIIVLSMSVVSAFYFTACADCSHSADCEHSECENAEINYEQISQERAWNIMQSQSDFVILDARTQSEYNQGHIANAILIPYDTIDESIYNKIPDKNTLILVYCRSGNRSKLASERLVKLGYKNVKEFGGISTWDYGVVTD